MAERPVSGAPANCPDVETLAAYADGRLDLRAREAVEAHLADCADCYELVIEVVRSEEMAAAEADAPTPMTVTTRAESDRATIVRPVFGRTRMWALAGSVLTVAAALVLVVRVQPEWWQRLVGDRDRDPRLEKLVAAVGQDRTVEPRLTGGFPYGPLRSQVRSGASTRTENLSLLAAEGELQKAVEADPTAENLHALGLAQLLIGRYEEGVRDVEEAAAQQPSNPRIQSDLAAAYLAHSLAADRPDEIPRALEATERALALNPELREAAFNRALALERLHLPAAARDAWNAFLLVDGTSGWADEARRHLTAATVPPGASNQERDADSRIAASRSSLLEPYNRHTRIARVEGKAADRGKRFQLRVDGGAQLSPTPSVNHVRFGCTGQERVIEKRHERVNRGFDSVSVEIEYWRARVLRG